MTPSQFNKNVFHPLQTYEWGRYFQKMGFKVLRNTLKEDRAAPCGVQVLIQKSAVRNHSLAYVPRAPLPGPRQFAYLKAIAKKHSCLSLKIEPCQGWLYPVTRADKLKKKAAEKRILSFGGIPSRSVYPRHTLLVSLKASTPVLLRRMHYKTRYNIRLAERKGVIVLRDNSDQCFERIARRP